MIDPDEIEIEPIRGLPGALPKGERILWQGAPEWRALAVRAFHTRKVALYFALLIAWQLWSGSADGAALTATAASTAWLALAAAGAISILNGLAWAYARTSVYTLTTRRLVIRSGLALPVTFNLPLAQVESAALSRGRDGVGNVSLSLIKPNRVALLVVWPHARPWRLSNPEPMLRCIADAETVAGYLAEALRRQAGPAATMATERPAAPAPGAGIPADIPAGLAA